MRACITVKNQVNTIKHRQYFTWWGPKAALCRTARTGPTPCTACTSRCHSLGHLPSSSTGTANKSQ